MKLKIITTVFPTMFFLTSQIAPGGQPPVPALRGPPIGGAPIDAAVTAPATNATAKAPEQTAVAITNSTTAQKEATPSRDSKFVPAGFDKLAGFNLETGADSPVAEENRPAASEKIMKQVPPAVKALNDKPVAVRGFMLPMQVEHGLVTEFLLLRNQMGCCYGMAPGISEWIDVHTAGKGVKPQMDDLITVYGTLHIGAIFENSYLTGMYKMECEQISASN